MSAAGESRGAGWLLALHSTSEVFGVGLQPLGQPEVMPQLASFPLGRALANALLPSVEAVLPASEWPHLARIAVAIGPGGFTGTRLTVSMARLLCQQLGLPLDGISSFHLMASRLLRIQATTLPLILCQALPRHGLVAGLYGVDPTHPGGVAELVPPRLFLTDEALLQALGDHPQHRAQSLLPEDVGELLAFSQVAAQKGLEAPWASVVPLYPTSPVGAL
jgi:tRNA threonylcarbamoyladenosine biosynthesis protein TsaB